MAFLSCKIPDARLTGSNRGGPGICGGEPNRCNVIGGTSKWFECRATDDATVMIDTRGSTFDTVLAQNRIDCSTDGQPGANWRRVSFQAQRNASSYVVVDGANVNDLTGRAQLN